MCLYVSTNLSCHFGKLSLSTRDIISQGIEKYILATLNRLFCNSFVCCTTKSYSATYTQAKPKACSELSTQRLRVALGLSDALMDWSLSLYGLIDTKRKLAGRENPRAHFDTFPILHQYLIAIAGTWGLSFSPQSSLAFITVCAFHSSFSVMTAVMLISLFSPLLLLPLSVRYSDSLLTPKLTGLHMNPILMQETKAG